jgi:carbon monoxide dehydrogenase subunit G
VKVAGSYSLPVPPERAYELLQDPDVLAKCLPGCEGLDRAAEGEYAVRIGIGMAGMVRISERIPSVSFRLNVEVSGKLGFMKGDGVITVSASDGASNVQFEGEVQVGGAIAMVGERLTENTSKMIVARFFDCLGQRAAL